MEKKKKLDPHMEKKKKNLTHMEEKKTLPTWRKGKKWTYSYERNIHSKMKYCYDFMVFRHEKSYINF